MAANQSKMCFVIMPYGTRTDITTGDVIDFDLVYQDVIKEPVEALGFAPVRAKDISKAGSIHRDMFTHIAADAVAIVDITMLNPNVFYELGVRHSLRPSITVLIKKRGSSVPFNIQDERVIEYPSENGSYSEVRARIRDTIEAGLGSTDPDSPIFTMLQEIRKDWTIEQITQLKEFCFSLISQPGKKICVLTGDLRGRRDIDVWVNSENTNMQMARFFERSLSAIIRYEGARKDENGEILEDTIADELRKCTKNREVVTPGTVYVTGSGDLFETRGVKKIFHAASVYGVPGGGYHVIEDVEQCVTTALRRMDQEAYRSEDLRTIVFPMMGTGVAGGQVETIAPRLIQAAVMYLRSHPESHVTTVYFSAWNHRDLEACLTALKVSKDMEQVS